MGRLTYKIAGKWGPRFVTPTDLATRFLKTVDALRAISPSFDGWLWIDGDDLIESDGEVGYSRFADIRLRMVEKIIYNVYRDERTEEPEVESGYTMQICLPEHGDVQHIGLIIDDGCEYSYDPAPSNTFEFSIAVEPENEDLLTYSIFRPVMLLLAETWEVAWCQAYPNDILDYWPSQRKIRLAWMTYLSPRLAPRVTPPSGVIVEHRPNGGLFMAATTDRFSTDNRDHRVAAHLIEVAAEPLDTLLLPYQEPYR